MSTRGWRSPNPGVCESRQLRSSALIHVVPLTSLVACIYLWLTHRYQRVCGGSTFVYPWPLSQHTREFPVRLSNWLSVQRRHWRLWRYILQFDCFTELTASHWGAAERFWKWYAKLEGLGTQVPSAVQRRSPRGGLGSGAPRSWNIFATKSQIPLRYLVADRSEAGRRPATSWNLAYHLAR